MQSAPGPEVRGRFFVVGKTERIPEDYRQASRMRRAIAPSTLPASP